MHFANVAEALRYPRSADGGSLRIQHTQVSRAAKANATRNGFAFTFEEPSSLVVSSPPRSQRTPAAPAPNLSTFGFTSVRCACCGANICGTKHTCSRCHRVVDEACMQLVERLVQCFSCTCRACGSELASHTVECHACHFRVHPTCTTNGVCTWCAAREPVSPDLIPKPRKFYKVRNMHAKPHANVEMYFPISSGNSPRVAPHFGAPSLAVSFSETSSTAANEEEETEEVEDEGQGGKRERGMRRRRRRRRRMWCGFWAGPMMDRARGRGRVRSCRQISNVCRWAMVPTHNTL